ncbi:MAG: hypothetical protein WC099_02235 [Candidatus Paceibacterota bacterium]
MKQYTIYALSLFLLFIVISAVVFIPNEAQATVGGPTFIYGFTYNPIDESVYYTSIDLGGRGCPPELMRLSLNSGTVDTVYSCDDGEKMIQKNGTYDESLVIAEINKITKNFKSLTPINLKDNRISIDVNYLNSEKSPYDTNEIARINLTTVVYQDAKKIVDFPITGCNKEQPFTFEGYAIPGFDKRIILLLSTKSDCFEGGYLTETLYSVGGVNNLNKVFRTNTIKEASALTPHEGTLIVFESEETNVVTEVSSNSKGEENNNEQDNNLIIQKEENESPLVIILIAFVAFIFLGIFLGKFLYTKK